MKSVSTQNKYISILGLSLLLITAFSLAQKNPEENTIETIHPIEFNSQLDLTNDQTTKNAIGFYMINRKNTDKTIFQILTPETWIQMNMTVSLGKTNNASEINAIRTYTNMSGIVRRFRSDIKYNDYHWEEVNGWIDQEKNVYESYGYEFIADPVTFMDPTTPDAQARAYLIDLVGEDYYRKYFTQWKSEVNIWEPENWYTSVGYFYYIEIEDYSVRREISIYYNQEEEFIRIDGVPRYGNLMPFSLNKENAIVIASPYNSKSFVEVVAGVSFVDETPNDVFIDRYVWVVSFYHDPRRSQSGSMTAVYVDPVTRQVYDTCQIGWSGTP